MNWIAVSMDVIVLLATCLHENMALIVKSLYRSYRSGCVWSGRGPKCAGFVVSFVSGFVRRPTRIPTRIRTYDSHSVVAYNLATSLWSSIPIWSRGGPEYERYAPSPRHTSRRVLSSVYSIVIAKALLCAMCFQSTLAYNAGTSSRNIAAITALTEDGKMYSWGNIAHGGGDNLESQKVRSVYSTQAAFTLITEEGLVYSWGYSSYGGDKPTSLVRAQAISSTERAFAALTEQGTVVAWGDSNYGGTAPSGLTNVQTIFSDSDAFAALKKDGTVFAWGNPENGGSMSDGTYHTGVPANLANVKTIYSADAAFAALKEDGTVQAWGYVAWGGAGVPANLTNVIAIYATGNAFAALRKDGTVRAWGDGSTGGAGVPLDLTHVTAIYSTFYAFCAHLSDGRVRVWGSPGDGGIQPSNLDLASSISSNARAFAALTEHGTVVAWGNPQYGGGMTDVTIDGVLYTGFPAGLKNVRALYSTYGAFAALMEDGTVQAWGDSNYGGKLTSSSDLKGVQSIFSTYGAFAALKEDGTIFPWGVPIFGGSMTDGTTADGKQYAGVPSSLQNVKTIFGETRYFADSTAAQLLPCPHNTYGPGFPDCTACPQGSKQPVGRPGIRSKVWSCIDCDKEENGEKKFSADGLTCDRSCAHDYHVIPYNWYGSVVRLEGDMCYTCPPGSYFADGDCKLCPLGRYQNDKGQSSCSACPAGQYTSSVFGSIACEVCPEGKTVLSGRGYTLADCFKKCPEGQYGSKEKDECLSCNPGTYNNQTAGTDECTACERGKSQPLENQRFCFACSRGKWANTRAATFCTPCPPGSFCPDMGMVYPKPCGLGQYSDAEQRESCAACPAGQFQNDTGSAKCRLCPVGNYLPSSSPALEDGNGATSSDSCLPCPSGTYGDKEGLQRCSQCPTGQIQPAEGQISCNDCTLEGKIKTSNAVHTECVDNPALMSSSLVEVMFTKGLALSLSFSITGVFVLLGGVIHFTKSKYTTGDLGTLAVHQVLLKSALPGFSFGSEAFLIFGIMTENVALGATMLTFRLLHPVAMLVLCFCMFLPNRLRGEYLRSMELKSSLNHDFIKNHIPLVGILLLVCLWDVTMLQFMPFRQSQFYTDSRGYPTLESLKFCLTIKTIQTLVSVICQLVYLTGNSDLQDPTMSSEAKGLFSLSIIFSLTNLVMGLVLFFLRSTLLAKEEELPSRDASSTDQQQGEVELGGNLSLQQQQEGITYTGNPMLAGGVTTNSTDHRRVSGLENETQNTEGTRESAMRYSEIIKSFQEENTRLKEENKAQETEISRLREREQQQQQQQNSL